MKVSEKVDELKEILKATEVKELERMNYRLSDAIREGSKVSGQAHDWCEGEDNLCAMSAAVVAARARGFEV
jgi:hypothetical protein